MMNRLMDAVKEDRTAVRGPTHDAGDRVQPGQPCQGPSVCRHQVNVGISFLLGAARNPLARRIKVRSLDFTS